MSYGRQNDNPYYQGPAQESGHGYGQANPYAQEEYELGNVQQPQASSQRPILSQADYLKRVDSLNSDISVLEKDIDYIAKLHERDLSGADGQVKQQLEHAMSQAQIRNTAIKDGIKGLERDLANTTDGSRNTKTGQLRSVKTKFKAQLDHYQAVERKSRDAYREQIARQYRIVNPNATDAEVQQAADLDWGNEGVFQTALRDDRTGHAQSLLGNVRARHNELQQIEHTLCELAVLYQELATVVEQQDPVIEQAENDAIDANQNITTGVSEIEKANKHARNRRKLKWWCLLIVVIIIIVVALGVGLGICLTGNKCGSGK